MSLGFQEWLVILIIVLVLFGAPRIPQLMRSMGQGLREFKQAVKEGKDSTEDGTGEIRSTDSTKKE